MAIPLQAAGFCNIACLRVTHAANSVPLSPARRSLATLLSHVASSFLYNPDAAVKSDSALQPASGDDAEATQVKDEAESQPDAAGSSSMQLSYSEKVMILYSKLDAMLNQLRQVREIVGWKPTSGSRSSGPADPAAGSSSGSNALAFSETDGRTAKSASMSRSGSGIGLGAGFNPQARPFEPSTLSGAKRPRTAEWEGSGPSSQDAAELEEGEELALPPSNPDSRKRKLDATRSRADAGSAHPPAGAEDEEEEGSIPSSSGAANAPPASTTSRGRPSRSAGSRGGAR